MAAFTIQRGGNWSDTSTSSPWYVSGGTPCPIPGSGDTVTLTGGFTLAVDVPTTVGSTSFTTGGTPAINFDTNTNGFTLNINANLTLIGDMGFATASYPHASTINMAAGTTLTFFPPMNQQCAFRYANQQSYFNINGTALNPCTVTTNLSNGGTAANTITVLGASRQQGFTIANYCNFSHMGTSSAFGLQSTDSNGLDTQPVSITNCTFTDSSAYFLFSANFAHGFTFTGNQGGGSNKVVTASGTWLQFAFQNNPTGGRTISGNVFLGTYALGQMPVWLYQQGCTVGPLNYFDDWGAASSQIEHASWAAFDGNFVRKQNTGEGEFAGDLGAGGNGGNYFFVDSTGGANFVLVTDFQDFHIRNNVFDVSYAGSGGNLIELTEASTGVRSNSWITNNIQTIPAAGTTWFLWAAITNSTPTNAINVHFEHNTAPFAGAASSPVQISGSGGGERSGGVASIQSNIFWCTGSATVPVVANTIGTGAVADAVAAANCGYNAYSNATTQPANYWTVTHVVSGATTCSDGTPYESPMTGATQPGGHDINYGTIASATTQGPKFVAPTRWLGAWAVHKGYTASGTPSVQVAAALAALQGNTALIADLVGWVQAGFVPQDSGLENASYPGDPSTADAAGTPWPGGGPGIGAMAFAANTGGGGLPGPTQDQLAVLDKRRRDAAAYGYRRRRRAG